MSASCMLSWLKGVVRSRPCAVWQAAELWDSWRLDYALGGAVVLVCSLAR